MKIINKNFERLAANAKVTTVLSSFDTLESEGRQMKHLKNPK
jgi:hypothetical protein